MKHFEDFSVGESIQLGEYHVSEEEIIRFASQYDPQSIHTDPAAATQSDFGGLIASGWHTGSIFMRLQCDAFINDSSSIVSPGVEDMRWLLPVRAGDSLSGSVLVLETRRSRSKPDRGLVRCQCELTNQRAEQVMTINTKAFFGCRSLPHQ